MGGGSPGPGGRPPEAGRPYLRDGRGYLPRAAPARARARSRPRARRPEAGPARNGREGRGTSGKATPLRPRAREKAGPVGQGCLALPALLRRLVYIHEARGGSQVPTPTPRRPVPPPGHADPASAEALAPVGRPRLPPLGGVSTWSQLKNVSLPLLRPSSLPRWGLLPRKTAGRGRGRSGSSFPGQVRRMAGPSTPSLQVSACKNPPF